ncbi:SDR family NAD(P)-dependent oxidoreductase [Pyrobaculum sp.]|uniref:SDR family NAD(P)-dependent oxidoreductase n=1 Tax=Pyrobaculum sp. TaxID=2004705 RepID=UPI00317D6011
MGNRILVTGGAGFIGSHIVDRLIAEGYKVRVVDNFSTGRIENLQHLKGNPNLEIIEGDLKNEQNAKEAVKGTDAVFHFAANPEVRVSTTNPKTHFEENVVATFNLLEAMREFGVREMVFASSSSVYGEPQEIPVDEDAPVRPVSVYGASKAACENMIHAYSKLYGIKAVILRYANVVGPRLRHGVIYDLMMKLRNNREELEVLGDGTQVRSYIYVTDAVEATLLAWRRSHGNYEIYNVASEDWITVNEVVNTILDELRLDGVKIIHKPVLHGVGWPGDVKRIALKIDRLKALCFKPRHSSIDAVRLTVKELAKEVLA